MLFTTSSFFILLLITFLLYYLIKEQKGQMAVLILASFVFYAWNFPKLLILLASSIAINIFSTYAIINTFHKKKFAVFGVVANLSILAFFKYSPLIGRTFFDSNSDIGGFLMAIPLPIGISFFTFQGISLIVDTFKEKEDAHHLTLPKKLWPLAMHITLFKAFFPQLIAGPIVKAHEYLPQINKKYFSKIDWEYCLKKLIIGYFLKMVIADNLKDHTLWMTYPYFIETKGFNLLLLLFGYSMQIFADFAGYSSIALGLSSLFGYRLIENFRVPYISQSFSEFWRRWHISLSTFLREYLYIPLGGNRHGKYRTYFNLMITMILGGLWHGAAWSYAVWGAFHGIALALERLFDDITHFKFSKKWQIPKIIFVFMLITFGWLLFKLPDFNHVILYVQKIFTNPFLPSSSDLNLIFFIGIYSLPVILYHSCYKLVSNGHLKLNSVEPYLYAILLFLIIVNSGSSGDFIYFQF